MNQNRGLDGESGLGLEVIYAKYHSDDLPESKYPSDKWGCDEVGVSDGLEWHWDDHCPTLDEKNPYLFMSMRHYESDTDTGLQPNVGETVECAWEKPWVAGVWRETSTGKAYIKKITYDLRWKEDERRKSV